MPLVTSADAAKQLGIGVRTLQRWASEGLVTPDLVTAGGHKRWDVDRLRQQLRELAQRNSEQPPTTDQG